MNQRQQRTEVQRGILARLAFLFFLVHPGSACTFDDPKTFLLSRYPNRDVVPSSLLLNNGGLMMSSASSSPSNGRSFRCQRRSQQPQSTESSSALLFVRPPPASAAASAATSTTASSSRGKAMQVVIGSFISELERSERQVAGGVFKRLQMLQPSNNHRRNSQSSSSPEAATATAAAFVSEGADAVQRGQHVMVRPPASPASSSALPSIPVDHLLKRSATSVFDAVDGLLSFVESRIVTTELAMVKALGGGNVSPSGSSDGKMVAAGSTSSSLSSLSSSSSSAARYDLVGFMDLDPFEKSRRYFKRNPSLTKMIL